jgi:hypothetical protein
MAFLLSTVVLLAAVPRSYADNRSDCQRRIQKAENDLDKNVRRYSDGSGQAQNARANLNNQRELKGEAEAPAYRAETLTR